MSYAPGIDGPPVSQLQSLGDDKPLCCGADGLWARDRYYASRWADDAPECYVWTCPCGKNWTEAIG